MTQLIGFMEKLSRFSSMLTKAGLPAEISPFLASHFLNLDERDCQSLLAFFRVFDPPSEPARMVYSEKRSCFFNSACNAKTEKQNLLVAEGFATTIIPVMHAWNVRSCGVQILDATWYNEPDEKRGANYFGAIVRPEFMAKHLQKCLKEKTYYSILDQILLRRLSGVNLSEIFFLRDEPLPGSV